MAFMEDSPCPVEEAYFRSFGIFRAFTFLTIKNIEQFPKTYANRHVPLKAGACGSGH